VDRAAGSRPPDATGVPPDSPVLLTFYIPALRRAVQDRDASPWALAE
jgi:hypothetical protein